MSEQRKSSIGAWLRHNEFLLFFLSGIIFIMLVIIDVQAVAFSPLVFLRFALSMFLGLFAPGYTIQSALFPRGAQLHPIERLALSFGISLSIFPLLAVILSYSPWGIRLWPVIALFGGIILIASIVAMYRRSRLPEAERPSVNLSLDWWGWWHRQHSSNRLFYCILGCILLCVITITAAILTIPKTGSTLTEFYLLGAENVAEVYPKEIGAGKSVSVIVGVVNQEGVDSQYQIIVRSNGQVLTQIAPFTLTNQQHFEKRVDFILTTIGKQQVELILGREGFQIPYRLLHLWVDVQPAD